MLRRFHYVIYSNKVFGTHKGPGGFWISVGHPSAILILPAAVKRIPPKTSSMYPSSISLALCSDGMRCIKPLAPSRNETNSSRVSGGADGAILLVCAYGCSDQPGTRCNMPPASPHDSFS